MTHEDDAGIIEDGCEHAYKGTEQGIRAQVESEYADRLKAASVVGRLKLRYELEKEIQRRIDDQSPPDALY